MQNIVEAIQCTTTSELSAERIRTIVAQLEEDIALGRLRPRERLIEEDLALRFDAKRHVIRQVLIELQGMGIIVRQRNKGASVRDFSPSEVGHIYDVRALLEERAAQLIPLPNAPLVAELRRIHKRRVRAVRASDLRAVFRENLLFHKTLFRACGNPSLVEAIDIFALKTHSIRSLPIANPRLLAQVTADHAAIIDALAGCDRTEFVRRVVDHLLPSKKMYLELHAQIAGGE
jgi:DNA-binding GntR family transcriptional regulator